MRRTLAFTLIEMLTVIAITAVLLTIIVLPIFQSFNLTRAAEAFSNAQDLARSLTEKISDEIGTAVSVRGTSGTVASSLNQNPANLPVHSLVVQVPGKTGLTTDVALPWTKIDIIPPTQTGLRGPKGGFVDPVSGKVDPTLKTFKGQVQTPVVPGALLVRYSIGLQRPFALYNDPYSGILMAQGGGRDNLFTLRRSVAAPFVFEPDPGNSGTLTKTVNTALFGLPGQNGVLGAVVPNSITSIAYDDPRFLVPLVDGSAVDENGAHENLHNLLIYHWLGVQPSWETSVGFSDTTGLSSDQIAILNEALHDVTNIAHTVVETEVTRYDMIMPQYNLATRKPAYDTINGVTVPRLTPLIQFKPTVISNDPAAGQEALRAGEETDNAALIAPDVYKTQYGLWNNGIVRSYPPGYASGAPYNVGYVTATGSAPGFSIYANTSGDIATEFLNGVETFDVYSYDNATTMLGTGTAVYPFTMAVANANGRSGWLTNSVAHNIFTPYDLLPGTGKIISSFDISTVGHNALENNTNLDNTDQDPTRPNLPTQAIPNAPLSALNDPSTTAAYSGSNYDINTAFNVVWNQHTYLQPNIQRFIDLRVTPNEDGTPSPLYPVTVTTADATNFQTGQPDGSMLNRCRIVPGTEVVVGPDQNPGDHYGHPIRYTRVTGNPGPDQYRINYVDLQEPNTGGTNPQVTPLAYENALGLLPNDVNGFVVDTYDPTNFVSATIQPRYKVGYIQLNSDPNLPIPQGYIPTTGGTTQVPVPFKIDYRFQFTGTVPPTSVPTGTGNSDVFAVDYDTRQLMQVLLTIRNYPQSNLPNPQTVTLKATATLKNVSR